MTDFSSLLNSPDFWLSVAFCSIILLAFRPLGRYLKRWNATRAAAIKQSIDDAKALRQKAENLLAEYEQKTKNKEKERAALLKQAHKEAVQLEKESAARLRDRLEKQTEDMKHRLRLVKEQGQRELKDKILNQLMTQTYKTMLTKVARTDIDVQTKDSLSSIFSTIDRNLDLIQKK